MEINVSFDIDGTLFNSTHRHHHLHKGDLESFNKASLEDSVNTGVFNAFYTLYNKGQAYLVTGRHESHRQLTLELLQRNGVDFPTERLLMSEDRVTELQHKVTTLSNLRDKVFLHVDNNPKVVQALTVSGIISILAGQDLQLIDKKYKEILCQTN